MSLSGNITHTVLMIRPRNFAFNAETAENNSFQIEDVSMNDKTVSQEAVKEFDGMVEKLKYHGVNVLVYEDTDSPITTDAVFPNNWFTTHADGKIITYPMEAVSRRNERREDIIEELIQQYMYTNRYGFEYLEDDNAFLEGTGSMVFDRDHRMIYACLSSRTSIEALEKCSVLLGYRKLIFHAYDRMGNAIYHTNVMMCVGDRFSVICLESVKDAEERESLRRSLENSGKTIIEISLDQMHSFAGNMLQLYSESGRSVLVMSESAFKSLNWDQLDKLKMFCEVLPVKVDTIEKASGGSVRCMMAEIFPSVTL